MHNLWLGRFVIGVGIQGRGYNGENPTWFGFSYGSWLPRFRSNGGRFRVGQVTDISGYWLCFHGGVTWWRN